MSLERVGSLAIGRKEAVEEESVVPFFIIGVMVVNFQAEGKTPVEKERLKTNAMKGDRRSEQDTGQSSCQLFSLELVYTS